MGAKEMEPWIVGSKPSERFPFWTRANVGEVFPHPVAPKGFEEPVRLYEVNWQEESA